VALALSTWWYVGWVIAAVVVVIAATLLLAIIFLGRRVTRQADDITVALDGTRANTLPLWDVKRININLDRITRGLAAARKALGG
jgi:anti-sigma-K factor RskA